jgi:hypothetical protein
MTDDGRVLSLLSEVLDGYPTTAPDRLLASVLDGVRTAPQAGGWRMLRRGAIVGRPSIVPRRATGALLAAVAVVVAAIAIAQLLPRPGVGPGGKGSPSPSVVIPSSSPSEITLEAIEDTGSAGLRSGVTYTSRLFQPEVRFRLLGYGLKPDSGLETDFCSPFGSDAPVPYTSSRTIVLAWRAGCVSDVRFIRPFAVECGTPDTHPDAATLAAAILAKPNVGGVRDYGSVAEAAVVPPTLFLGGSDGRVVDVFGGRFLDPKATDPDHCRLLPEPGSRDPVIEIRGDLTARLILLDVDAELVVIRAAGGGYDAATGAAARARGYGAGGEVFTAMLSAIQDIEFK